MTDTAALLGKKEFADLLGLVPSYVTALIKAGRVVLDGEGRGAKVKVAESLALIESTSAGRFDVARRHAAARRGNANGVADSGMLRSTGKNAPNRDSESRMDETTTAYVKARAEISAAAESESVVDKVGNSYQAARAVREKYAALTAKAEYETLARKLIEKEAVDAAMRFIGAAVRAALEVFPDQTAPLVCAVSDLNETHNILTEACRNVLVDIGQAVDRQRELILKPGK